MTVHLRVKGWLTAGTIAIPADVQAALADLVLDLRDQAVEIQRLTRHSTALRALTDAITKHGPDSEQVNDAHRDAVIALKVE